MLNKVMKIKYLLILLLFVSFTTTLFSQFKAEIIVPERIKSGENVTIVVNILNEDNTINTNLTDDFVVSSDFASLNNNIVSIKKGKGSLTTQIITDNNFELFIENFIGHATVILNNSIPEIVINGNISQNEYWTSDYDYYITDDLTISEGVEVRIEKGMKIFLGENVNVFVDGKITAEGTINKPILFSSVQWELSWGGIEINSLNDTSQIQYCFFTNGGGNPDFLFGHSNSQAVIKVNNSYLEAKSCFFIDNKGKALGSTLSNISLDNCLISRCDMGGEFHNSIVNISNTYVLEIPNDDGIIVDDDNDCFYFYGVFPNSNESSAVENSVLISGKDDGIDHNGANLKISNCWIENFFHEGIACSNQNFVEIINTLVKGCEQGIEAGYGSPQVYVDHCVSVENEIGLRFGDSYTTGCTGQMSVMNTIVYGNDDNIRNFDLATQDSVSNGIMISYSITNDEDYNNYPHCISGIPIFDNDFGLMPGSPGIGMASDGSNMGLLSDTISPIEYYYIDNEKCFIQNFPNPFYSNTKIEYVIPFDGVVEVSVLNLNNELIKKFIRKHEQPGKYSIKWEPQNISAGIYFLSLKLNGILTQTRKTILLK